MEDETGSSAAGEHRGRAQSDPTPHRQLDYCAADEKTRIALSRIMKALPWVLCLPAIALGSSYLYLSGRGRNDSSLITLVFLAFCAFVVTGQLLPILWVKLAQSEEKIQAPQESVPSEE